MGGSAARQLINVHGATENAPSRSDPLAHDVLFRFIPGQRSRKIINSVRRELLEPFPDNLTAELPIRSVLPQILESIKQYPFTIVSTPTGSGKTIGIPLALLREGYGVVVTQPRIIAARAAASYLAQSIGEDVGQRIGYRTSLERSDSHRTVCQYVTDGLEVMRMLNNPTRACLGRNKVLMIDEFHERNLNHDALLGAIVDMYDRGKLKMPVIISSATINSAALARFLGDANVITADGRLFPIEYVQPGICPVTDGIEYGLAQGKGVLHIVAGKREIEERLSRYEHLLTDYGIDAELLALHSEVSAEQQIACMREYDRPKVVVSTPISEASITVPGISVVVDEGLRRLILTKQGVQGLYTAHISNAECAQRAGRAGRTGPGVYICHHPLPPHERPDYPPPEILRLQLDNLVLRFKALGERDLRNLRLPDQPPLEALDDSEANLLALGCVDRSGKITSLGHRLARIPISVNLARMIVEGERLGVLKHVLRMAAVIEAGGIAEPGQHAWKDLIDTSSQSDAMAQLDLFDWASEAGRSDADRSEYGIDLYQFNQAAEHMRELEFRFKDNLNSQRSTVKNARPTYVRKALIQAFTAGFKAHVFFRDRDYWRSPYSNKRRVLSRDSIIDGNAEYLIGLPWDLNLEPGGPSKHFLRWATAISKNQVPKDVLASERELRDSHEKHNFVHPRSRRRGFPARH